MEMGAGNFSRGAGFRHLFSRRDPLPLLDTELGTMGVEAGHAVAVSKLEILSINVTFSNIVHCSRSKGQYRGPAVRLQVYPAVEFFPALDRVLPPAKFRA